ncbi:cupin domain-containing protein [Flagellimonas olearia]|nr:cupin domain-containing protein [Allomuricauda olearia]
MMQKEQKSDYLKDILSQSLKVIAPKDGEQISMDKSQVLLKVTSEMTQDQFGIYQVELAPKSVGADLHYHRFMEEVFVVISGNLTLTTMDTQHIAIPGTLVHIPKFTVHGFRNDSDETVKALIFFNPSMGREGFFKGLKQVLERKPFDPNLFAGLYNKYDSVPYQGGMER